MLEVKLSDDEILVIGRGIPLIRFRSELAHLISMEEVSSIEQGGIRIPRKFFHCISDLLKTFTRVLDFDSANYLESASLDMTAHLEAISQIQRIL